MYYSYHRLLLVERTIPPIFQASGHQHPEHSRQDYLKEVFSKLFKFQNRRIPYAFANIGEVDSVILGRVGRLKAETIEEGPETGFAEKIEQRWHAANYLVDTSDHADGQKIAIEEISEFGSTLSITRSMIDHINSSNANARWEIYAETIADKQEFWEVVSRYKGKITELELSFVAPNIFGGRDKTTTRLRELRQENNMQTVSVSLHNREGALNLETEDVRQSVDFVTEGGGRSKVKASGRTVYNSEQRGKKVTIDSEDNVTLGDETQSRWPNLIKKLFRLD